MKPRVILVTGRPGVGKSTLAARLASALRVPLLSRDALKEGIVSTTGKGHAELPDETNRRVTDVFFETLRRWCEGGVSVVGEAAFQHARWAAFLTPLGEIAEVRMLVCECEEWDLDQRRARRAVLDPFHRHAHGSASGRSYLAPQLPFPTLTVDTTVEYRPQFEVLVAFARGDGRSGVPFSIANEHG